MIISLGILSIFQLMFLPGLVVAQLAKLRGVSNIILVSLALSPIINYLFVFITTAFGLYNRLITLIFFGIELVFLIYLTYPILNKTLDRIYNYQEIAIFFKEYLNISNANSEIVNIFTKTILFAVFSLAVGIVLYYVSIYVTLNISVFTAWDAVVSWDRWAVDWYGNHFPDHTWHYPQLVPANWSLTYQFIGDSRIKLFAKDFMGLIEIYVLLTIFVMGINRPKVGYFFGVVLTAWLQWIFGSRGNGYVDSAVAFFALSSVACLLIAEKEGDQFRPSYIYIGAIIAAGAAITKQAGLWIVLVYPLLLFCNKNKKENYRHIYRYIPGILAIYALMIFPWYGYKEYQILKNEDGSEIVDVTTLAVEGRSWAQRLDDSLALIQTNISSQSIPGKFIVVLLCILMLFVWGDKFYQSLIGFIIIPFTFLWALFFSYDTRNLNLVIPFIGLTTGIGLQNMLYKLLDLQVFLKSSPLSSQLEKLDTISPPIKILKSIKVIYLIIPALVIFLLPIRYSDSYLINRSIAEQKKIGYLWLNQKIYDHQSKYGFDGKILTDYQYLGSLPGLEQYYEFGLSNNPSTFLNKIDDVSVGYALLNSAWMSPEVDAFVHQNITQGTMKIIFERDTFLFVTTCRGPCAQ